MCTRARTGQAIGGSPAHAGRGEAIAANIAKAGSLLPITKGGRVSRVCLGATFRNLVRRGTGRLFVVKDLNGQALAYMYFEKSRITDIAAVSSLIALSSAWRPLVLLPEAFSEKTWSQAGIVVRVLLLAWTWWQRL